MLKSILAYFVSFTIIVASTIALRQDNLKARLAYSTISQLSYVILGVALLTPSGIIGSVMHIVVHAFGKITLFFCAGAIYVTTHKTKVSELDGIGKKMPFTMSAFTLATISMIGIPPSGPSPERATGLTVSFAPITRATSHSGNSELMSSISINCS